MIFDESTLRKINALTLVASRIRAGKMRGDRRSSKRGASIEFADYRNYVPGDDLRRLDWNIYARLNKPFIKLFEEEEDLAVYVLLDGSKSMDWGNSDSNKFVYGRRIAAALGAIALSNGDALLFQQLGGGAINAAFGPVRGNHQAMHYFKALEPLQAEGQTLLNNTLLRFSFLRNRPGLVFLITDLLDPAGYKDGLTKLLSNGHQVVLLHLLSPDELQPTMRGDLKLVDIESGDSREVSLDPVILEAYDRQLEEWLMKIRSFCASRNINYVQTSTGLPWQDFMLRQLRREGIVK